VALCEQRTEAGMPVGCGDAGGLRGDTDRRLQPAALPLCHPWPGAPDVPCQGHGGSRRVALVAAWPWSQPRRCRGSAGRDAATRHHRHPRV